MSGKRVSTLKNRFLTALSKVCSSGNASDSCKSLNLLKYLSTVAERYDQSLVEIYSESQKSVDCHETPNTQGRRSHFGNNPVGQDGGLSGKNYGGWHQNAGDGYRERFGSRYQNNIGGQNGDFSGYSEQNNGDLEQKPTGLHVEYSRGFGQNLNQLCGNNGGVCVGSEYGNWKQNGNFGGYDWNNNGHLERNHDGDRAQHSWGGHHRVKDFSEGNANMQNQCVSIQERQAEVTQNTNVNFIQNSGQCQRISNDCYTGSAGIYLNSPRVYQHNEVVELYQIDQSPEQHQKKCDVGQYQANLNYIQSDMVASQVSVNPKAEDELAKASQSGQNNNGLEELDGFVKKGELKEAVEVLGLLEKQGVLVDLSRLLHLIQACGEAKALQEAKSVHEHIVRSLSPLKVSTYNRIIKMYSECGSMDDAFDVFNNMREQRNLTSWDTMITLLAKNGLGEDALDLFSQFKQAGLKPDGRMFIGVFSACSVLGDIDEGMMHFESMSKDYGIIPFMEHYVSIVDMLGSTGYLDEALEFIENMPMEPSVDVWERLMNLCRIHGNLKLGDRCAELVEQLDPSHLSEQSKIGLILVETSGLEKEKEVRKRCLYLAGDTSHPETGEIYAMIRGLQVQMKDAGYIADTKCSLHDIDQEEKEEALLAHSERLAVSHALLTTPARAPIRIFKNLRVCSDCHTALKIISKTVGREIIARDAKRFHHFKDGLCSCKDYW